MNEFVERSPGGKLFHSCEHPPFSILRCITTLRLLAGVRDGEHIDLSGREGVYQWRLMYGDNIDNNCGATDCAK